MGSTYEASIGAMIDNESMEVYRKKFESHRLQNRHATEAEILCRVKEYIKSRIDGIVDEACNRRLMDLTTVTASVVSSTVIPLSGVPVVLTATVMECINFSVTLGLIPLLNVSNPSELTTMMSEFQKTVEQASENGSMQAIETAVLEILKNLGLGDWLWAEILKDILVEMIGETFLDSFWILTPILFYPKYKLHRRLIMKMNRKLGDKAYIVHHKWAELNCVPIEGKTTTVSQH